MQRMWNIAIQPDTVGFEAFLRASQYGSIALGLGT